MLCLEIGRLEAQRACDGKPGTRCPTEVFSTVVPFDFFNSSLTPETDPCTCGDPDARPELVFDASVHRVIRILLKLIAIKKRIVVRIDPRRSSGLKGPIVVLLMHANLRRESEPVAAEVDQLIFQVLAGRKSHAERRTHDCLDLRSCAVVGISLASQWRCPNEVHRKPRKRIRPSLTADFGRRSVDYSVPDSCLPRLADLDACRSVEQLEGSDIAEQPGVPLHRYIVEQKYGIDRNIAIGAPKVGGDEVSVDRQMVPAAVSTSWAERGGLSHSATTPQSVLQMT